MSSRFGVVGIVVVGSLAFAVGGAVTAIDNYAGKGTARAGLDVGIQSMAGMWGEAAAVPAKVTAEVKPGLQAMQGQLGGILGPSTPAPAAPTADPSDAPDGTQP